MGPKATYVGENGLALSMKIATNLSVAVQMLAFSEGVLRLAVIWVAFSCHADPAGS